MTITASIQIDHAAHIAGVRLTIAELPAITTGTDAQIGWASKIRDGALTRITEQLSDVARGQNDRVRLGLPAADMDKLQASLDAGIAKLVNKLATMTDAARWIDLREALDSAPKPLNIVMAA